MNEIDIDELFLMTNLYPATTGLPMVIWVGPNYGAQHDVRIKVMQHHGTRMDPGDLAVVGMRPQPHLSPAICRRRICAPSVNGSP